MSRHGSAGADVATTAAIRGSAAAARIAPIAPIEWPRIAADASPPAGRSSAREAASASVPELAGGDRQRLGRVRAVAADVDGEAVEPRGVEELDHRQEPVAGRLPAVDEGDARARARRPGRDEPAGQGQPVRDGTATSSKAARVGRA